VGLAFAAITVAAIAVPVALTAGHRAAAAPTQFPGGDITTVCTGSISGTTFTLTANCGPTTAAITVPSTITTVDGGGHTISATDIGFPEYNGAILTNATAGQTMDIKNLTVSGPATGFQICTNSTDILFGIYFNDASGSVSGVTVENIWQQQTGITSPSCQTGTAIRAAGVTGARTVTITNTTVDEYQKNGIDGRGTMTMDVSGSTMGPPHALEGLIAQNGLVYVGGAGGTATGNTIYGSGDEVLPGPPGGGTDGTAVILFGASGVTITNNTIIGAHTDIGIEVYQSTGIDIGFNKIGRTAPDLDPTLDPGIGVLVCSSNDFPQCVPQSSFSSATLTCNTFTGWKTNIVGAVQMSCTLLPDGTVCHAYSADVFSAQGGKLPYKWSVESGSFPPGLTMAPTNGAVTGTPTKSGTYTFTVKVDDSSTPALSATQSQTVVIAAGSCAVATTTTTTTTVPDTTTTTAPVTTTTTTPPATTPTAPAAPITSTPLPVTG
jgi:hypothetical protein